MGKAIKLATYVFLQRGDMMRKKKEEHPNIRDLLKGVFNTVPGRKICTDEKGYNPTFGNTLHQSGVGHEHGWYGDG